MSAITAMFEPIWNFLNEFVHNYAAYEYPVASAQLFLAMLGMGALLTPQDFLLEVKKPAESKEPWDYYHVRKIIPAADAALPLAESKCKLVAR